MKFASIFYIPVVIYRVLTFKDKNNPMNNVGPLSGKKVCVVAPDLKLDDIK